MPSDADFIRLEKIALLAVNDDRASAYASWLAAKGGGLKAQAKVELDVFLKTASTWSEKQKQAFVMWLDEVGGDLDDRRVLTPQPLMARLVLPTLKDWTLADPKAAEPHLLQGRFHDWALDFERPENHFRTALQLDPSLLAAKRGLLLSLLGAVQNNQHHLPEYYHGGARG